jgi:signal transduction histidine kinase
VALAPVRDVGPDIAYSPPLITLPVSVFVRRSAPRSASLDDLVGLPVAVVEGDPGRDLLPPGLQRKVRVYYALQDALFALLAGQADALAYAEPDVRHLAHDAGVPGRIAVVGRPIGEERRALAYLADNEALGVELSEAVPRFVASQGYGKLCTTWLWSPASPTRTGHTAATLWIVLLIVSCAATWRLVAARRVNRRLGAALAERGVAEESLAREVTANDALTALATKVVTPLSLAEVSELLLRRSLELTGSRRGYVAYRDLGRGQLVCGAVVEPGADGPAPPEPTALVELAERWGWGGPGRLPVLSNDPVRLSLPAPGEATGEPPPRFVTMPVVLEGHVIAQLGLGDPASPYSSQDLGLAERIISLYVVAVERARAEEALRDIAMHRATEGALRASQEELEARVSERTDELRRVLSELARSNMELERFAYVASHDLKEPLRTVSSSLELLRLDWGGELGTDADGLIDGAIDGILRMELLINDLLAYSRVGTGGAEMGSTDMAVVVHLALSNLRAAIRDSRAEIALGTMPTVRGDAPQLVQLLQNLVGNAIKFRGEAPPSVSIEATRDGDMWRFAVRDNGVGFDQRNAERIFEIFRRLHRPGAYPGTGVGLAICRKIVESHGGRIWAESEPGEGATFSFTVPATEEYAVESPWTSRAGEDSRT